MSKGLKVLVLLCSLSVSGLSLAEEQAEEQPVYNPDLYKPVSVSHSIEAIWLTKDASSCLIQLNNTMAKQKSCVAYWMQDREHLVVMTRIPFATDGNTVGTMFTIVEKRGMNKQRRDKLGYTSYTLKKPLLNWTLSPAG